ncbi:hypothetical protein Scep_005957 [Stephania cephalantha]|uniref:Uncharacterized protein n=1 Tax=Stephania cephalantha TaxID=152367 RepID=A0AAP0K8A6_9MAGN
MILGLHHSPQGGQNSPSNCHHGGSPSGISSGKTSQNSITIGIAVSGTSTSLSTFFPIKM